ncbi:MAG: phenylalanine--tRNA ligase subunit beta [Rickettsiales bacterium]|jgi:phenylalanyl-tRNA synthetase beta chain|nr:phenylalanine--tRNA ligase subunit beta [Rickettsiales bacterium]
MKWTYDWLLDYLETDVTPAVIRSTLDKIGLEVEDVSVLPVPFAARIVECVDIPDTHLHLLQVDYGAPTPIQVVCGAPNARVGLVSALALPGCKIGDMEIKAGKIRGFDSNGMMCSECELGISDNHEGIIELPDDSVIGQPVTNHQSPVTIFDASITPNRPDYLAVIGIARDLAAAGIGQFRFNTLHPTSFILHPSSRKAIVKSPAACPTYRLREIHGIKIAPSNPVIAGRLRAIGITPRNACIDATNYICYDLGQPMHCFDADEIKGDIIIRNAAAGEKFTDLFGAEHELIDADLVIADADGILALAGIIGGARGMTTDKTKNIILESAYFEPVGIRKTRRRLGLNTDASYRYERGIDPTITGDGIAAATDLIMAECGGEIVGDYAVETEYIAPQIKYNPELFKQKTGIELSPEKQNEILKRLGFDVSPKWVVTPTPARVDIEIPESIVSEIIRIYGYDNIKTNPKDQKTKRPKDQFNKLKSKLTSFGLTENISFKFGNAAAEKLLSSRPNIAVANPISEELNTVRNGLMQNMLDAVAFNNRYNWNDLAMFELGSVFDGDEPGQQHDQLIIARTGDNVSIYDVRADLLELYPNAVIENDDALEIWGHPYRAGRIPGIAQFAELHPGIAKKFGIKTNVVLAVIDNPAVENLEITRAPDAKTIAEQNAKRGCDLGQKFPLAHRDFAFVLDNKIAPDDITSVVLKHNPIIINAKIFDVFEMPEGQKSVAFKITIRPIKNMSDDDFMELQNEIIALVESTFDAQLRT